MAVKSFELSNGLLISVYKRRSSRSIRLSLAANGEIRVSQPLWVPYRAGVAFAETRLHWINEQRPILQTMIEGQQIGKQHRLHFKVSVKALKVSTRLTVDQVIITHPLKMLASAASVQTAADKAAIRALRQEAAAVLPGRLQHLAQLHSFQYTDVSIKQLTSRWGSCDQQQHIALNLFLMQLPWVLIDYVLLHELVHTKHMDHGAAFWAALEQVVPGAKQRRAEIRKHKPVVLR